MRGSSSPRLVQGSEEITGSSVRVPFPLKVIVVLCRPNVLEVDDLVLLTAHVVGNE